MFDRIKDKLNDRKQGKEEQKVLENAYKGAIAQMAEEGNYDGVKVMYATRNMEEGLARDLGLTSEEDGRYVLGKANNIGSALVKAEKSNYSEKSLDQLLGVGCSYGVVALGVAKKAGFIDDDSKAADILDNISKKAYAEEVGEEKPEGEPSTGEEKKEEEVTEEEPTPESTIELYKKAGADKFDELCSGKELTKYRVKEDVYGGIEDTEKYKKVNVVLKPEHFEQEYNVEKIGFLKEGDNGEVKLKSLEERYTEPFAEDHDKEKPEDWHPSEEKMMGDFKEYLETAKYSDTGENIFYNVGEEGDLLKSIVKDKKGEEINVEYSTKTPMTKVTKGNKSSIGITGYITGIEDIRELASK